MRKKIITAVCAALTVCLITANFGSFAAQCRDIRSKIVRLHILANSDSESDQSLKLKVRDDILEKTRDIFDSADKESALKAASENLDKIEKIAEERVIKEGYNYDVKVQIVNMYFDTKAYGDITMPAGRYDALRVTIGNAEGHNWWCVMYPPLCLPAAQPEKELSDVLNKDECDIVENEPKYEIKFKFVEIFEQIKQAIFG